MARPAAPGYGGLPPSARPDQNAWSVARHAALLQCDGYVERQGQVVHVMAKRLIDRSYLIRGFELSSRDFH